MDPSFRWDDEGVFQLTGLRRDNELDYSTSDSTTFTPGGGQRVLDQGLGDLGRGNHVVALRDDGAQVMHHAQALSSQAC